jgi:hypothetical protein
MSRAPWITLEDSAAHSLLLPDAADKTTTALVSDAERSPAVRGYLGQVMQLKDKIGTKEPAKASVLTEASLRVKRRERLCLNPAAHILRLLLRYSRIRRRSAPLQIKR